MPESTERFLSNDSNLCVWSKLLKHTFFHVCVCVCVCAYSKFFLMMASQSEFKVLSWNINGLKARLERQEDLLTIFKEYDVVILQETHVGETDLNQITEAFRGEYDIKSMTGLRCARQLENKKTMYLTCFSSSKKGVGIVINKQHKCLKAFWDGGDYAWINVDIEGQKYTFVSVYYHSNDDDLICDLMVKLFYSFLTMKLDLDECRLVIGGDFNTSLSDLDVEKNNSAHEARRKRLNQFISIVQLSDVWGEKRVGELRCTYSCSNPMSRLDYIFMFTKDLNNVKSCEICNIRLSDHFPLGLTLKMNAGVEMLTSNFEKTTI